MTVLGFSQRGKVVRTQSGDTLKSLAQEYGVRWTQIAAENPQLGNNPNAVLPPQRIYVPPARPELPKPLGPSTVTVAAIAAALTGAASAVIAYEHIAVLLRIKERYWDDKFLKGIVDNSTDVAAVALHAVIDTVMKYQLPKVEGIGPAQRHVIRMNEMRRAAYVANAVPRLTKNLNSLLAQGVPQSVAVPQAVGVENRYYSQHLLQAQQRMQAASKIDALGEVNDGVLGWYANTDGKTTPECRAANGKNFRADTPPAIGWPGVVHANCRCYPGKPWPRGKMLP
jgi:SPP1 gp7 family putative phage head morphogenesis protein